MLCGCSFSEWGWDGVALSAAYIGSQYLSYKWLHPIATQITYNANPKIAYAPLLLILTQAYPQYIIM